MSPEGSNPAVAGSFRDRDGRVYRAQGRLFRGLSEKGLADFRFLTQTPFHDTYRDRGALLESTLLSADDVPLPQREKQRWAAFVEHPVVPVISYPYEWTFGMLRAAALLQLELTEAAYRDGVAVKDATPYNIQFVEGRPVFIDLGSFAEHQSGQPWPGYRQFCEMFLFPLMLQAYKGVDFQPLLRAGIGGIPVQVAARLFGLRDRLRGGVLIHVWLQSRLDRRYGGAAVDVRSELKSAGFNRELILANLRRLKRLVTRLEWRGGRSEWADYEEFHNYSEADARRKEAFVERCVADSGAGLVWDVGCNTGRFSRIAARHAGIVIAMDQDHLAVERLFRGLEGEDSRRILTLVQDVADPSPNWGWRNRERSELSVRARPDLVLCLALLHHVAISANIPVYEFVSWLADLAPQLVIEYVSRSDDKVKALLRNKDDRYADYGREQLEASLSERFDVVAQQALESGNRVLYWCRRRD